jgi:thioredoxin reductase (NADPH)
METVTILGSGPAGLTAAIYAARANLQPVLIHGAQPGGQLTTTTEVENYPGFEKGITGPELMEVTTRQAERFGTRVMHATVTKVDLSKRPFTITLDDGKTFQTKTLIAATGATAKYLIHRREELRASKAMQKRVFDNPKIKPVWNTVVERVEGENEVKGLDLLNIKTNEKTKLNVTGLFVAIGHKPNSELFKGFVDMDELGYIKTIPGTTKTKVPGFFAAGDLQDHVYRQAVTAAGTGCMAALDAERFLGEHDQ